MTCVIWFHPDELARMMSVAPFVAGIEALARPFLLGFLAEHCRIQIQHGFPKKGGDFRADRFMQGRLFKRQSPRHQHFPQSDIFLVASLVS